MTFDYTMRADGSQAVKESRKVEASLEEIEKTAARVGQSISSKLRYDSREGVRAFDSLTAAIAREKEMLDRIRGPMQQAERDLQTLQMLHKRGAIEAHEYANELERIRRASGGAVGGALPQASAGASLASLESKVGKLNIGQIASGANQAFELLNQKLHITDNALGSVIGSAVKFGATGAQIAGPWGAAIGAVLGGITDLVGSFLDAEAAARKEREEIEKQAKAYWDNVEATKRKKEVEEMLTPILEKNAKNERELAENTETRRKVADEWGDSMRRAADKARAYSDELWKVNSQLSLKMHLERLGSDPNAGAGQTPDQANETRLQRGTRDADIEQYASTKSYGATLTELAGSANKVADRMEDLEAIMGDIAIREKYPKVIEKAFADWSRLNTELRGKKPATPRQIGDLGLSDDDIDMIERREGWSDFDSSAFSQLKPTSPMERIRQGTADALEANQVIKDTVRELDEADKKAKALEESLGSLGKVVEDQLISGVGTLVSTLVEGAQAGDVAWTTMLKNLANNFAEAILKATALQALTGSVIGAKGAGVGGGYGGLLGMLFGGNRSVGGTYTAPGSSYGTDSVPVLFRMSPGETATFSGSGHTAPAASSAPQPVVVQNIIQQDRRELLPVLATRDGERAYANLARRFGMLR